MSHFAEVVTEFLKSWPLHLLTAALFVAVVIIAPQQAGLLIYKGALIFGGAIGAYWINRIMFKRAPPPKRDDGDRGERTATHAAPINSLFHTQRDVNAEWQLCAMVCAAMVACAMAA